MEYLYTIVLPLLLKGVNTLLLITHSQQPLWGILVHVFQLVNTFYVTFFLIMFTIAVRLTHFFSLFCDKRACVSQEAICVSAKFRPQGTNGCDSSVVIFLKFCHTVTYYVVFIDLLLYIFLSLREAGLTQSEMLHDHKMPIYA